MKEIKKDNEIFFKLLKKNSKIIKKYEFKLQQKFQEKFNTKITTFILEEYESSNKYCKKCKCYFVEKDQFIYFVYPIIQYSVFCYNCHIKEIIINGLKESKNSKCMSFSINFSNYIKENLDMYRWITKESLEKIKRKKFNFLDSNNFKVKKTKQFNVLFCVGCAGFVFYPDFNNLIFKYRVNK